MLKIIFVCVLIIHYFILCQCTGNEAWNDFQNSVTNNNREELVVTNVTADRVQVLKMNVSKWMSLSIGPICYTVGLAEKGLTFLSTVLNGDQTGFDVESNFIVMERMPSDAAIFHNRRNGQSEGVIVVSFHDQKEITWFRVSGQNQMQQFWTWNVEDSVEHISFFKIKTRHILFFVTSNRQGFLYEFEMKKGAPKRWFLQTLSLESPTKSSAFNSHKGRYYLSIPQTDSVIVYEYENNQFKNHTTLRAPNVSTITPFNIGFRTFFAVDGYNAGIYKFSRNGLKKQEISNSNLEGVKFWLPVPIETYRDEVILFTQRALDHSTHSTYEVDIITYNNGKFEEHEDIPCSLFDEKSSMLTCLIEENGILGSSYIVIGDKIALIVPRSNETSIIFNIHIALRENPDPREQKMNELLETKRKLEAIMERENQDFEEISNILSNPITPKLRVAEVREIVEEEPGDFASYLSDVQEMGKTIEQLFEDSEKLIRHERKSNFDTIFINGDVKFENSFEVGTVQVEKINDNPATIFLEDFVRKRNITKELKNKTFTDLEVDNLKAETANGIDTRNMAFIDDDEIILNGNITFTNSANIENLNITSGMINDVFFEDEAVFLGKTTEAKLEFEQIKAENVHASKINNVNLHEIPSVKNSKSKRNLSDDDADDTLEIPQNLTVTFINGENFTEFLHALCMVNVICYIPGNVTIKGKLEVADMKTRFLNNLKFPEEYILKNSNANSNIIGQKFFKNSLTASDIRSFENINGVDTNTLVTLTTDQHLGNLSFENLELTEKLDVGGEILGEQVEKVAENPTLQESNNIKSKVNFKNLEVKGNIIVEKKFNDKNYKDLLKNIVYSDENEALITVSKDFTKGITVDQTLNIKSNAINKVKLENFITKNTDQHLNINLLNGNIFIKNLVINGTYDGKNVTEIDENLIKLTGEQFVSSTLSFKDVDVKNLEINKKLNGIEAADFLYNDGDAEIDGKIVFNKLIIKNLVLEGNLDGEISGLDLKDISENYLSLTKNQTVETTFTINNSKVANLEFRNINNENDTKMLEETFYTEYIEELLNTGQLKVKNIRVEGSANIDKINDETADKIQPITILDIARKNGGKLVFENDVYLNEIELNKLSSVPWNEYLKQIVYKNQTDVKFTGMKRFRGGIMVENLIETGKINDIRVTDVLTKEGEQVIRGPVEIIGDVTLENVEIRSKLNDVPVKEIMKMSVAGNGKFNLKKDLLFERLTYIQSLKINGTVNGKKVDDVLKELVYKNKNMILENDFVFTRPVNITGNLAITDHFNDMNFTDINDKIVLTSTDAEIHSLVSFSDNVQVREKMTVDEDLSAKFVAGYNTATWLDKAVYVNKGLIEGHYVMDHVIINEELTTDFLNDLNMKKIIPLKSDQSIDYLHFEVLKFLNDIPVGKTVNNFSLPVEMQRTLMNDSDQDITPTTIFRNLMVRQDLKTPLINNEESSKLVTTNTEQNLTARYIFNTQITLESDLNTHGLMNGVDIKKWRENSLKLADGRTQNVFGDWNVLKNLTFESDVYGFDKIGGLDIREIAKKIGERKEFRYQFEQGIITDYENICEDVTYLYEKSKSQIYKFKYFEDFQTIPTTDPIKYVFHFDFKERHYLLVNLENCLSDLLILNGTKFEPFIVNMNTGLLKQAVEVADGDVMFLVLRGAKFGSCNDVLGTTNIWEFDGTKLELKFNMDNQDLLQYSLVPSTFYSLNNEGIIEYKIRQNSEMPMKYRKWEVSADTENAAFMPRGFKTGLSLRTGDKLILLHRSDSVDEDIETDINTEATIKGSFTKVVNRFIPGKTTGDLEVLNVGIKSARKKLLAIATHEETVVKNDLDLIKLYADPLRGQLFQEVLTYNPSSILSIEFNQGETLMAFLENKRTLQIYEYRGIQGFQPRSTIRVGQALSLFKMDLGTLKTIGIIHKNEIRILRAVMDGNKLPDDLNCQL